MEQFGGVIFVNGSKKMTEIDNNGVKSRTATGTLNVLPPDSPRLMSGSSSSVSDWMNSLHSTPDMFQLI